MFDLWRLFSAYWWCLPLAGAALVAYRLLGWRGVVAVASLGLAGGLYRKGAEDQRLEAERQAEARRLQSIKDRQHVDEDVKALSPVDVGKRLNPWMRDK